MRQGLNFGGEKFNREEIYEERVHELEALLADKAAIAVRVPRCVE